MPCKKWYNNVDVQYQYLGWHKSYNQCLKLSQKSCRSSCLESQIISIKLKKNQQKVSGPPPKLAASDLWEFPTLPTMHQSHIPQCTILGQKCAHVCTFLLQNDAFWDICPMHCWICEIGQFIKPNKRQNVNCVMAFMHVKTAISSVMYIDLTALAKTAREARLLRFDWPATKTGHEGAFTPTRETVRSARADPARGLHSGSVCRNCVVLFTPCCASAAGASRDRSQSDSSVGPAGIGSADWWVLIDQWPSAAKWGLRKLETAHGPAPV